MKAHLEIEMPTSCCECAIKSWDGEDDVCPFSGISALSIGRQDDCPLIPVPPHGRLIDADAVYNIFLGLAQDEWNLNTNCSWAAGFAEAMEIIENAPTVIPAEEGE